MNIILYSTDCPKCHVLEKMMETNNISYEVNKDMDTILQIAEQNNIMSAPILQVDEEIFDFSAALKWIRNKTNEH